MCAGNTKGNHLSLDSTSERQSVAKRACMKVLEVVVNIDDLHHLKPALRCQLRWARRRSEQQVDDPQTWRFAAIPDIRSWASRRRRGIPGSAGYLQRHMSFNFAWKFQASPTAQLPSSPSDEGYLVVRRIGPWRKRQQFGNLAAHWLAAHKRKAVRGHVFPICRRQSACVVLQTHRTRPGGPVAAHAAKGSVQQNTCHREHAFYSWSSSIK